MYPQSHCIYSYCPPCCCDNVCMWMSGYKDELGVSMLNGRVCGVVFMYPQSHHTYSYCPPCCCDSACMWMSGYKDALGVLDKCAHVPSITLYLQLLPTLLLRQCLHVDVRVQGWTGCLHAEWTSVWCRIHVPSITPYLQLLPTLLLRQCLHVDVRVQGCTGCFRQVCQGKDHVPSITLYLQLLPTLLLRQCLHVDVRVQGSSGCFRPVCTCTLNHTVPTVIAHLVVATVPACGCQGTRMHWVF